MHIFSYIIVKFLLILNHEDLLTSSIFDLSNLYKLKNGLSINIRINSHKSSIDYFFKKLYNYAINKNMHELLNNVENIYRTDLIKSRNTRNTINYILSNLNMMSLDYDFN